MKFLRQFILPITTTAYVFVFDDSRVAVDVNRAVNLADVLEQSWAREEADRALVVQEDPTFWHVAGPFRKRPLVLRVFVGVQQHVGRIFGSLRRAVVGIVTPIVAFESLDVRKGRCLLNLVRLRIRFRWELG